MQKGCKWSVYSGLEDYEAAVHQLSQQKRSGGRMQAPSPKPTTHPNTHTPPTPSTCSMIVILSPPTLSTPFPLLSPSPNEVPIASGSRM